MYKSNPAYSIFCDSCNIDIKEKVRPCRICNKDLCQDCQNKVTPYYWKYQEYEHIVCPECFKRIPDLKKLSKLIHKIRVFILRKYMKPGLFGNITVTKDSNTMDIVDKILRVTENYIRLRLERMGYIKDTSEYLLACVFMSIHSDSLIF